MKSTITKINNSLLHTHPEYQYLHLIQTILNNGERKMGRNGATYSYFGSQMRFSLKNNTLPLLTTKQVAWKTCLKELLWFIRGETDNTILKQQGVHIWDGNATREFLDKRGLVHFQEDELGAIYGHQWRNFNGTYFNKRLRDLYKFYASKDISKNGIDQLAYIIQCLNNDNLEDENNMFSRRLIVSAWNPSQLHCMALPPCHVLFQFYVNQNRELSCSLYQRSGDVGLGIPFNIASYSFLTHLLAHHCNLKVGEFIHTIGDAHIYENHVDALLQQLERKPHPFPTLNIIPLDNQHPQIEDYSIHNFSIQNYVFHPKITMDFVA